MSKTAIGLLISALALAAALWAAPRFKIDASAETLLTADDPAYLAARQAAQRYGSDDFILIAFEPAEGSIFGERNLSLLLELGDKLAALPGVDAVRSLVNVPLFVALESFTTDIDPDELTWEARRYPEAEFAKNLRKHPLYESLLFNDAYTALGIQVVFAPRPALDEVAARITALEAAASQGELTAAEQTELDSLRQRAAALREARDGEREREIEAIRAELQPYAEAGKFYLGGESLLAKQLIDIIKNDLIVFGAAIFVLAGLVLAVLLRRLRWVVLPMAAALVSVILTVGLLGGLGLKVTVISANVIALQIILTLALLLHFVVEYEALAAAMPKASSRDLVRRALKQKLAPSIYAGLTTCIGFGSLVFSGIQPVISFGWMMAIAVAVSLVVSLAMVPLVLARLKRLPGKAPPRLVERLAAGTAVQVKKRPGWIVGFSLIVLVLGGIGCLRLSAETSFLNYFRESTDVYRELSYIDRNFGGSTALDILYQVPPAQQNPDLVLTANAIQTLQKVQLALAERPAIGSVTSLFDFTQIAAAVNRKPVTEYELTALYNTLPDGLKRDLFGDYLARAPQELRISTRVIDTTEGLDRSELLEGVKADLAAAGIAPEHYQLTNIFVLYEQILSSLVRSQFVTLAIVYGAMAVVLLIAQRSLGLALICLAPNFITTALVLGALGLLRIPLDLMTMTIAAVAMGIGIDDTLHYVARYRQERRDGPGAVARTHTSVGLAMIYTTLVVVIGFSALLFSDFVPSVLFGLLTAIAMVVSLALNATLLPVLLARFYPPHARSKSDSAVAGV